MKVLALVFVTVIASGMAIPQPGAKFGKLFTYFLCKTYFLSLFVGAAP